MLVSGAPHHCRRTDGPEIDYADDGSMRLRALQDLASPKFSMDEQLPGAVEDEMLSC